MLPPILEQRLPGDHVRALKMQAAADVNKFDVSCFV